MSIWLQSYRYGCDVSYYIVRYIAQAIHTDRERYGQASASGVVGLEALPAIYFQDESGPVEAIETVCGGTSSPPQADNVGNIFRMGL